MELTFGRIAQTIQRMEVGAIPSEAWEEATIASKEASKVEASKEEVFFVEAPSSGSRGSSPSKTPLAVEVPHWVLQCLQPASRLPAVMGQLIPVSAPF